jgi:hypothetical protein
MSLFMTILCLAYSQYANQMRVLQQTNSKELNLSRDAASCAATQELVGIL